MSNVEADQERGNRFDDARTLQFAAIDRPHTGNFCGQGSHFLSCSGIVAAYDYVAVERTVRIEKLGCSIVKGGDNGNLFGDQLDCFLQY